PVAGVEDFFLRLFFDDFFVPFFFFFEGFAGAPGAAPGCAGVPASVWAIAPAPTKRHAPATTNSLRRSIRLSPRSSVDLTTDRGTVNQSTSRLRCCKAGRSRRTCDSGAGW